MSNNTPDYENNLAFAPTSDDDLNKQGRQVDVLVAALEKCEKLEKQLKIAVECLEGVRIFWSVSERVSQALKQIKELEDGK